MSLAKAYSRRRDHGMVLVTGLDRGVSPYEFWMAEIHRLDSPRALGPTMLHSLAIRQLVSLTRSRGSLPPRRYRNEALGLVQ